LVCAILIVLEEIMNTYKVMMKSDSDVAKVAVIVAAAEDAAMQFAHLAHPDYHSLFAVKLFAGSPAD
jgi:hypothetical protein